MAREVWRFAVTTPALTPKANAITTNLSMNPRDVDEIEIIVPPGPRGQLGFQLAMAGNSIIPANPGQFFVSDNEVIHWPVEGFPNSGAWQLISYNTGLFAHTIEIRFLVRIPGENVPATAPLLSADQLGQSVTAAIVGATPVPALPEGTPLAFVGFDPASLPPPLPLPPPPL